MKMVVVTSVEHYTGDIRKIFAENKIRFYSESSINNFRFIDDDESDNWFGSTKHLIAGHILFTFLDDKAADKLQNSIKKFTEENKVDSPIRIFQLNVEKSFMSVA